MITIVNKKKEPALSPGIYVGRPSPLGNPYLIGVDGCREIVIEKYRVWLKRQLLDRLSPASKMINNLCTIARHADLKLVCWCAPLLCHAEIIKKVIEERLEMEKESV